jgi:hypothetical protein
MFPVREEIDNPLVAFKATSDPDTMYLHEAMKEPDGGKFVKAIDKEVRDQMDNGNFSIIPKIQVPKGEKILPTVWQMKKKRDIKTRKIKKYKARLNIDGSRMEKRGSLLGHICPSGILEFHPFIIGNDRPTWMVYHST